MTSSISLSRIRTMSFSLPSAFLLLIALDVALGFQGRFHDKRNPAVVGRSLPLLTTTDFVGTSISVSRTALFDGNIFGMEGDPLEEDRRQRNAIPKKRFVPHQKKNPQFSSEDEMQPQEQPKQRLVRPSKPPSTGNERKATTSTTAGVNMELRDPKERKLVRHATASAAYGVDAFKGKKKKIIKPWSSGRKKHRNKQNNTGGIAREAYGEELKVELKNKPKEKRLVMARSAGNQDAAKALISGGSKAKPLTAEDLAEDKRLMEKRSRILAGEDVDEDDFYYDGVKYENDNDIDNDVDQVDDGESKFVRPSTAIVEEQEDDVGDAGLGNLNDGEPKLVRLSTSMVKEPEDDVEDTPNLVRLSSSIVRQPEDENSDEPNLVRLESSIVREPEKEAEEELKFYTRSETVVEEEEQRLVRAVRASEPPSSDEPKLVRPNIVKEKVEGPKLVKPNIVKAKVEGPKLVRPNVFRAKDEGPKLVRANVQKEKRPRSNLVRPTIVADGMDVGNGPFTGGPPLVRPTSSAKMKDFKAEDFMYGANASTSSPTNVPVDLKSKTFVKPAFTTSERTPRKTSTDTAENSESFMYGSRRSSVSPTSVPINTKPKEYVRDISVEDSNEMEKLMYGANKAATSPTAVSVEDSNLKKRIQMPDSTFDNPMDNLMYGANQATASPTVIPFELESKKKFVRAVENNSESLASDDSVQVEAVQKKPEVNSLTSDAKAMDDLMYGYQGVVSSPTAVKIETNPTKYVKPDIVSSVGEDQSQGSVSKTSSTLYPDGDKRKENSQPRLVRAPTFQTNESGSKQKRYVKPSTSAMNRAIDWDAANPNSMTTNPTFVGDIGREKRMARNMGEKKKYVQPSTSLMNNAPDWDAVQPATSTANPSVVSVDGDASKSKKGVEYVPEERRNTASEEPKKKYVQPSASLMNNAPDWDAVQPATSTANPSVVSIDGDAPKSKKGVEYVPEEKSDKASEEPKKKYVQPSASLMDSAPDWDAVQPATSTANPSLVSIDVDAPRSKKGVEYVPEEKKSDTASKKPEKKYVQPSASLMDSAPDWDAVQPATSTANPSVVSVDVADAPKSKKGVEYVPEEKNVDTASEKRTKKYVKPPTSLMDSAPDWNAVQPAISTANPSQVYVNISQQKREGKDDSGADKPRKKKYVRPSASMMDSTPDWDAVQPAISTANPAVVNVDGINNTGKEKRFVRPSSSSSMEGEPQQKTRPAPADTPFEYKQIQSIPKENPAGAKPIEEEDAKTKLPAAIAHAAGSSSDGWTPQAHFPSDVDSSDSEDKTSPASGKKRRTTQYSTMENYDPDALPRPTGVIPLTVSSSAKDKTQLFRGENSLEPVEDDTESSSETDDEEIASSSKANPKKLFLYDGGNSQPKEPWEFTMEGGDTKLDENLGPNTKGSSRLQEKTVSPFTRNVSKRDDNEDTPPL